MSRPVSETCPVCGTPGRIVGGDEGTQHFEAARSDDDRLRSALDKIARAERAVDDLCSGRLRWVMRVPAEPDHDPDLIISNALRAAREALTARGVRVGDEGLREAARAVVDERPMDWNATDENPPRIILPEVVFDLLLDRIDGLEAALSATPTPPEIDEERLTRAISIVAERQSTHALSNAKYAAAIAAAYKEQR